MFPCGCESYHFQEAPLEPHYLINNFLQTGWGPTKKVSPAWGTAEKGKEHF
jgi:hypothetical protein